jgi:hypothetical protein
MWKWNNGKTKRKTEVCKLKKIEVQKLWRKNKQNLELLYYISKGESANFIIGMLHVGHFSMWLAMHKWN